MKQCYFSFCMFAIAVTAGAQVVNIPDANFKNALVNTNCTVSWEGLEGGGELLGDVDTNNNGEIEASEAAAVEGLILNNQNISSLNGIEAFTGLWHLECNNNNLTTLSVTQSQSLIYLDCSYNQLTSLESSFSPNEFLMYELVLDCRHNQLATLSIPFAAQLYVYGGFNPLTQLLPANESYAYVDYLYLENTNFVDFNPNMSYYSLILHNCPFLTTCTVGGRFSSVTNNPALVHAKVYSGGKKYIHDNPLLQSIDFKDGYAPMHIGEMDDPYYDCTNNPSLEFVCIDDLGNWHDEGGTVFFNHERGDVFVSPGVAVTYYCDFTPGGAYNTLNGSVHYDCNGVNAPLDNADVQLSYNNFSSTPDANGNFVFYSASGGTVTPAFGHNYFTVTPANYTVAFSGTGNTQNVDFCIVANGVHPDLTIAMVPIVPARPGFDATYKIIYTNQGTQTQSGSVILAFEDDVTDFVSASPSVTIQAANTLSWDFSNLAPFETREISLTLNVNSSVENPAVNIGDALAFNASLNTAETDETPTDNATTFAQVVVGSYDPNDKAVSQATVSPTQLGDYLYYTVRFQNTGTYLAENVVVRDLLSEKLDLASLEIVSTSHAGRTVFTPQTQTTPGNKLEFFFEGLDLPAAQDNEPESHGFVTYKIKPKNTLALDEVIENTAEIYFDYNAPIVTNTVTTTVTALGLASGDVVDFAVYPNPVTQILSIRLNAVLDVEKVSIYNALGQLLKNISPSFENGSMTADIGQLTTGTYFIQIITNHGKATKKLTKL